MRCWTVLPLNQSRQTRPQAIWKGTQCKRRHCILHSQRRHKCNRQRNWSKRFATTVPMNVRLAEILKKTGHRPRGSKRKGEGRKKSHATARFLHCNQSSYVLHARDILRIVCMGIRSPSNEFGDISSLCNIHHVGQIWTQFIHSLNSELLTKAVSSIGSANRKIIHHLHLVLLGHRKTLGNKALSPQIAGSQPTFDWVCRAILPSNQNGFTQAGFNPRKNMDK